jgi:Tat protein secretion system quality control protein TatD with DNase activity
VAEEIARLKDTTCEDVLKQTEKNAKEIYGIA